MATAHTNDSLPAGPINIPTVPDSHTSKLDTSDAGEPYRTIISGDEPDAWIKGHTVDPTNLK